MAESDEFSPLIQRHVTASAAELRAEAAAQMQLLRSELKSDIQDINQRSLRMEALLQELISQPRHGECSRAEGGSGGTEGRSGGVDSTFEVGVQE